MLTNRNHLLRSYDLINGLDHCNTLIDKYNNINSTNSMDAYIDYCDAYCPDTYIDKPLPTFKEKIIYENITINHEINNLTDLIKLINKYPLIENAKYNIDMHTLHKIKPNLLNLDSMVGMETLKSHIVDQIIYYIQDFHNKSNNTDFMHTVIYGPPGTGKTEVAKIIGSIFSSINILSKSSFKKVTRADLIAGYLGQTALKTKEVINEALGGVLFIDEAYSLGNPEKRDSFAKECIDTLCEALTFHKDNLMVIIAGYEEELNTCFFAYNQGLNSRFIWRFNTDDYTAEELRLILISKINNIKWSYKDNCIDIKWFEKNMDYFKYYGRDIETFLTKIKIAHSRRVFCLNNSEKTIITKKDIEEGFKLYLANNEVKNRKEKNNRMIESMYS